MRGGAAGVGGLSRLLLGRSEEEAESPLLASVRCRGVGSCEEAGRDEEEEAAVTSSNFRLISSAWLRSMARA
ncbi:hypothetical protein EYF80_056894 [Liparis tanakae]|uniref:Uncharacterized protein n=1 Tax=Liparis tanakae TaxID=230148 RepID=A0A4Z2EX67_9TELE|nr:hypothetical protein EYF80_056894 [Liparis tanakae]